MRSVNGSTGEVHWLVEEGLPQRIVHRIRRSLDGHGYTYSIALQYDSLMALKPGEKGGGKKGEGTHEADMAAPCSPIPNHSYDDALHCL